MSEENSHPQRQSAEGTDAPEERDFVQIPKWLIREARSHKLSGTQYELWLYLWELDPWGTRWVEIPSPIEIAGVLQVDPRTIQRAAQRLNDCELFEFEVKRWKARNTLVSVKVHDYSTGKEIRMQTKRSKLRQKDPNVRNRTKRSKLRQKDPNVEPEPSQGGGSGSLHIDHIDQILSDRARERSEDEPERVLPIECFELAEEGSFKITAEYRNWLMSKAQQLPEPPVLIERWIESESLKEANQRQFLQERYSLHRANVPRPVPDRFQIETACLQAVFSGDRHWALSKLQQLWVEGWHDLVEDLVQLYPGWGFEIIGEGVRERSGDE
jgi:hypothetical protein